MVSGNFFDNLLACLCSIYFNILLKESTKSFDFKINENCFVKLSEQCYFLILAFYESSVILNSVTDILITSTFPIWLYVRRGQGFHFRMYYDPPKWSV